MNRIFNIVFLSVFSENNFFLQFLSNSGPKQIDLDFILIGQVGVRIFLLNFHKISCKKDEDFFSVDKNFYDNFRLLTQ